MHRTYDWPAVDEWHVSCDALLRRRVVTTNVTLPSARQAVADAMAAQPVWNVFNGATIFAVPVLVAGSVESVVTFYDVKEREKDDDMFDFVVSAATCVGNCYGAAVAEREGC